MQLKISSLDARQLVDDKLEALRFADDSLRSRLESLEHKVDAVDAKLDRLLEIALKKQ